MSQPFLGEIKIIPWNFSPKGWAFCNGQFLPINQNQALFSILGTMYGGNGQTTFALPDFRGRVPIHQGSGFIIGQGGGQEFHTLTLSEMPAHTHTVSGANTDTGAVNFPNNNIPATTNIPPYNNTPNTTFHPSQVTNVGGSQPHENRSPFLVLRRSRTSARTPAATSSSATRIRTHQVWPFLSTAATTSWVREPCPRTMATAISQTASTICSTSPRRRERSRVRASISRGRR